MIYESFVWKKELKKELNNFRKMVVKIDLSEEPGIPDNINLKVEKFFFVSAFIIRKLNEAKKLSNELNGINISVDHFKRIRGRFLTPKSSSMDSKTGSYLAE